MNEREKNDPLREFGERLNKARAASQGPVSKAPDTTTPSTSNALAFGWRPASQGPVIAGLAAHGT